MKEKYSIYDQIINAKPPEEIQAPLYALKIKPNETKRRREFPDDINYRCIKATQRGIYKIVCNCCGKEEIITLGRNNSSSSSRFEIESCFLENRPYIYYCEECKPKSGKIDCIDCKMKNYCYIFDSNRKNNSFVKGIGCMTVHNNSLNTQKTCLECGDKTCQYYDENREINYFAGNFCMTKFHKDGKKQILCKDCDIKDTCKVKHLDNVLNYFNAGTGCMTLHNFNLNTSKKCKDCSESNTCDLYDENREINYFAGPMCMTVHHNTHHKDILCKDCDGNSECKFAHIKDECLNHFCGNLCMTVYHSENNKYVKCKDCEVKNTCIAKHLDNTLNHFVAGLGCMTLHNFLYYKYEELKYCENCKKETLHDGFGRCKVCNPVGWNIQYCKSCETSTLHHGNQCTNCNPSLGGFHVYRCEKCNEDTLHNGSICCKCYPEAKGALGGAYIRYCKVCNSDQPHYGNICLKCHPESLGGHPPNRIIKNNILFWKNWPAEELCEALLNGSEPIENHPELEIHFGKICYNRKDILTDEQVLFNNSNFTIRDGVEYSLDHSSGKYVESNIFFKKHYDRIENNTDSRKEIRNLIEIEGFEKKPIVITGPNMWNRDQTDKLLVNEGFGWICYIKLFKGKPFICGKTGTSKVSNSPVDFDFIVGDSNDSGGKYSGLGREYVRKYYPDIKYTDFEYVLIKGFTGQNAEADALNFEKYITCKYNLFSS